jgi:hypothetical protein
MNAHTIGSNYDGSLNTKQIAALLRQYVKKLSKFSGYKFSIRSDYNHIRVEITSIPDGVGLLNPDWCYCQHDPILRNVPYLDMPASAIKRFNSATQSIIDDIDAFLHSYNFDDSDSMTDYFHVNFYINVSVSSALTDKHYKLEGVQF